MATRGDSGDAAAQTPDDSRDVAVGAPAGVAGGIGALVSTMKQIRQHGITRGVRSLLTVNQSGGFDCPGCAWPEPRLHRSAFEFCENGAKAVAWETTEARADRDFFARHSVADLGVQSDYWLGMQGRLTEPMVLRPGATHYTPIAWDEAFSLIAAELRGLASPDEALFYTSGRTSNEAAFLYQLFVRQLGTNNLPDCSNMCHESSGYALKETLGVGKGTVQLEDFALADAIFVIGQNPGTNHPRMLSALQAAAARGCRIVSINPLREAGLLRFQHPQDVLDMLGAGTELSSLYLQVRIGGDAALLKGIMKELLADERRRPGTVFDHAFIAEHTTGYPELVASLDALDWTELESLSGVPRAQMRAAADIAAASRRTICCWAMGLTQHKEAVATIQEIVNLLLLGGHMGRPGAGACPVRGHSNVQGDRTMGIVERPDDRFLDRLGQRFGFAPPRHHGLDTVGAIQAMLDGRARVFFGLGGNFLSATPDTERTARALRSCTMTVHVSTKPHRSHLVHGRTALILPCLGRTEVDVQAGGPQVVSVENSMSVVSASRGSLPPASPALRSEVAIVCGLAEATLGEKSKVPWRALCADYGRIRDHIEAVIPGFEHYNERLHGVDGFVLPNGARDRDFKTRSGRAQFTAHPLPRPTLLPGQLVMMTIRTHDQFNTTVYGLEDRYRGISGGRRVVLMHPADLAERGLRAGDLVDLTSHFAGEERRAERFVTVSYDIPRGCAATYFPEANVLVPLESFADKSRTPTSKAVVITVTPHAPADAARA